MRLTAQDLLRLGVIDTIVTEPLGGAHRNPDEAFKNLDEALLEALTPLINTDEGLLRHERREKFLAMGRQMAG